MRRIMPELSMDGNAPARIVKLALPQRTRVLISVLSIHKINYGKALTGTKYSDETLSTAKQMKQPIVHFVALRS